MHFMVFTESFDAGVMRRFLDRLAGHFHRTVHLVVDGDSAHRSRRVRGWLAEHAERVELHFLPAYSPELNPDELVNVDLKRSLPMHSRARDQAQLATETRRFFHRRQRQPHVVRSYFGRPHVRYILEENHLIPGSVATVTEGVHLTPCAGRTPRPNPASSALPTPVGLCPRHESRRRVRMGKEGADD
ncbi:hypothetical protein GCM10010211_81660 [Streptomyces albospinus]|uniref:Tc1-like transposase DDE domain-containing protein n=2 Tax=Streptomyces albospinus TaxID=285515 RepID=A0ABQ2VRY4_9ACTN|nr:hypothetical protein GCM10010211_81660 [Streptomyces albospinus]